METRFIDGGEYVDRRAYIEARNINSQLRQRIAELEKMVCELGDGLHDYKKAWQDGEIKIAELSQKILALEAQFKRDTETIAALSKKCRIYRLRLSSNPESLLAALDEIETALSGKEGE